jgi:hypothetical protein
VQSSATVQTTVNAFFARNAVTMGTGGTGATTAILNLDGSNAAGQGSVIIGKRNGSGSYIFGDSGPVVGGTNGLLFFAYGSQKTFFWSADYGSLLELDPPTGNATVKTGNVVIGTSGKGIDFSATAGTGTSELLADYEEGTWVPSLGGTTTYGAQSGTYTKVGRLVFIRGILVISAIGTGSTTQISGLPFANASGEVCAISVGSFFASATAVTSFFAKVASGGSVINVDSLVIAGTTEGSSAIFANNTQFQFSGCYSV